MRAWILRMGGAALLTAAASALVPEGLVKRALKTVCAFVVLSAALSIAGDLDWTHYAARMEKYREEGARLAEEGRAETETATRLVIQERLAEYILDKARGLGIADCTCAVRVAWSTEGVWVPVEVAVTCRGDREAVERLRAWMTAELGIPAEKQQWEVYGGGVELDE